MPIMIAFLAVLPVVGGIIVGVKWIAITALPWLIRFFAQSFWPSIVWFGRAIFGLFSYFSARNVFIVGMASWGIAALLGWGDEYINFVTELIGTVGNLFYDFLFDGEEGFVWDVCMWGVDLGCWIWDQLESVHDVFGEPFTKYGGAVSWAVGWISKLNQFFPIVEAGYLFGLFLSFIFFFLIGKTILKLIPGIG